MKEFNIKISDKAYNELKRLYPTCRTSNELDDKIYRLIVANIINLTKSKKAETKIRTIGKSYRDIQDITIR